MKDNRGIYGFLSEFIIMICIFSIVSIVSVTLFSRADLLDKDTESMNRALFDCENIAEKMKTYNGEDIEVFLEGFDLENIGVEVSEIDGRNVLYQTVVTYLDDEVSLELEVSSIGRKSDE